MWGWRVAKPTNWGYWRHLRWIKSLMEHTCSGVVAAEQTRYLVTPILLPSSMRVWGKPVVYMGRW